MKYSAYLNYKDSGVAWLGQIPDHWEVKRSKYIYQEVNERSKTGDEDLLSVSEYYGVKPRHSIVSDGDHISRAASLIGYKKCSKDDLVMNIMLAWKKGLGVTKFDGIVSPAYCVFSFNNSAFPLYMHYLFRTDAYTTNFKSKSSGIMDSRLRLYPGSFGTVETLLPPIKEQQEIACYLDKAIVKIDALIQKQTKLIELLKEKRKVVISNTVTHGIERTVPMKNSSIKWIDYTPKHWHFSRLRFIFSFCTGLSITKANLIDSEGTPCINYGEIHSKFGFEVDTNKHQLQCVDYSYLNNSKSSLLSIGDFVFADTSEDLKGSGNFTYVSGGGKVFAGYHTVIARQITEQDSRFLAYLIDSEAFRHQIRLAVKGVKVFSITQAILKDAKVWFPAIGEQKSIVSFLDNKTQKIDILVTKSIQLIALLKEKKTALISAAVMGRIDIRGVG
jgi:type I restriction enzyme, S subunit